MKSVVLWHYFVLCILQSLLSVAGVGPIAVA